MKLLTIIPLLLLSAPAQAWEFRALPVCTLDHATEEVEIEVTFDPRIPEYAINLTLIDAPWPAAPAFGIRFEGSRPNLIVTDRHQLSDGDRTLSVRDSGFGNVLNGLEFNDFAIALAGDAAIVFPLDGAAGPVEEFRACITSPGV